MGGDELTHFPTPTEAFGVRSQVPQRRAPSTVSSQSAPGHLQQQQQRQQQQQQQQQQSQQSQQQLYQQQHNQNAYNQPTSRLGPPLHPMQSVGQYRSSGNLPSQKLGSQPNSVNPSPQVPQNRNFSHPVHSYNVETANPSIYNSGGPNFPNARPSPQTLNTQHSSLQSASVDPALALERQLRDVFDRLDRNRDGKLNEEELSAALVNYDGTQFKPTTVKLMIRLFDTDFSGGIEFREFYHLWNYISHWKKAFQRYDIDQNSRISFGEYQSALENFGYRLPTDVALFVFQKFGQVVPNKPMSLGFDMFVESLIWLLRCTNIFKKFDSQGNGVATIKFQDFVHEFISFL
ncbi:hypothetical protein WICMUC_005033 [Wickerhamomyces mucosus]|uniref:EF-hand domain-containing protein n=1 Tax=Wickerhamomyces mucosus TaxID=1378264 RepID=A0A9P8PDC0_9ASCO|nr:hypothetical protein WICMUC_005033 [Wickerhamomyces mucosus]